jgi:8-oxo-dGTP pyrophosphatase MutT (NUDIX family)
LASSGPAIPRPAATVILLRRGGKHDAAGLEVLLAQRNPGAKFMPGVWVFPGGGVTAEDGLRADVASEDVPEAAYRAAAVRELHEEVGIGLTDVESLLLFSRWITPEMVPIRFDTLFYLAMAPAHAKPKADGGETVDVRWVAPSTALAEHAEGDLQLVFPTIKHLESLSAFASAEALLEHARARSVEPVLPKVIEIEGERRVVLPGEPGYPV